MSISDANFKPIIIMANLSFDSKSYLPQAFATGLQSRIEKDPDNSFIFNPAPVGRSSKRHTQQINYAEFDNYNDDFDEDKPTTKSNNTESLNNAASQKITLLQAVRPEYPKFSEQDVEASAKEPELLVPIKLSIEYNGGNSKLSDFFMWNLNDTLLKPAQFAKIMGADLKLSNAVINEITSSIEKQLEDYSYVSNLELPDQEYHVVFELSVSLNKQLYEDKFEWDLKQTEISPDMFADILVADLGLPLEFRPAICHGLYESILNLKKEIVEGEYNEHLKYQQLSGLIFERGLRITTESSLHNGNDQWEPVVETLTQEEIERREGEKERNIRRLKRENMRRDFDDFGSKRRNFGRRRFDEIEGSYR